jgi:hypothetical protein
VVVLLLRILRFGFRTSLGVSIDKKEIERV